MRSMGKQYKARNWKLNGYFSSSFAVMKKFFSRPKPPSDIETGNLDCKEKKLGSKKRVIDFNKLKKAPRPTKMQESIDSRYHWAFCDSFIEWKWKD